MTGEAGDREAELRALEDLLDLKGADGSRWSAGESERFAPLIAIDATARRLVAEARALDRLMVLASARDEPRTPGAQHEDLARRILAAAGAESTERPAAPASTSASGVHAAASGTVVPFPPKRRGPSADTSRFGGWTSGFVAASLLIGVVAGSSGVTDPVLGPAMAALSGGADDGDDETELAFNAAGGDLGGEVPW